MYYIEQTEGSQCEAAKELRAAVLKNNFNLAREILLRTTGRTHLSSDKCWWLYGAPRTIKTHYTLTDAQRERVTKAKRRHHNDERSAKFRAHLAEENHGGKWQAVYEY